MSKIGFIGTGNMAEAIIKGIIANNVFDPQDITASDISQDRLNYIAQSYSLNTTQNNASLLKVCDIVVLSVKPQVMQAVLDSLKESVPQDTLFISIAAGVKVEMITSVLGDVSVVRVMPNTPALVGEAASAIFANEKALAKVDIALNIFSAIGKVFQVEDENLIDAVTAVSGSGPAYFFMMMEEMIKAGVEVGLDYETAKNLTLQTALGSAKLALQADEHGETPKDLRKKVTSPGGTTKAALDVFYGSGTDLNIRNAVKAARDRRIELSA